MKAVFTFKLLHNNITKIKRPRFNISWTLETKIKNYYSDVSINPYLPSLRL